MEENLEIEFKILLDKKMDIMSSIEGYKKKTILINMLTKYYCYVFYKALSVASYQEKTS